MKLKVRTLATALCLALTAPATAHAATGATEVAAAAAAIGATFEAAGKIREYFAKPEADRRRTRADLAAIKAQNAETHRKLDEVLIILGSLGVTVREAVRNELSLDHQGSMLSHLVAIQDNYELALGTNAEQRVAIARLAQERAPLAATAEQMMHYDLYGFAHFDAVGQAMGGEFIASRLLREPASARRGPASRYLTFFTATLNPNIPGSVGQVAAEMEAHEARLIEVLRAEDAGLSAQRYVVTARVDTTGICSAPVTETTTFGLRKDDTSTYRPFVISSDRHYAQCPQQTEHNGGGGVGKANGPIVVATPDPVDPGFGRVEARASYLNDVSARLAEIRAKLPIVRAARNSAIAYRDAARHEVG